MLTQEELDKYFDDLHEKYVPVYGQAELEIGEIVRAMCRIGYRWYNDGDYAGYGYGLETCGPFCAFLMQYKELQDAVYSLMNVEPEYEKRYERVLITLENVVHDFIESHPDIFTNKNTTNSLECDIKETLIRLYRDEDDETYYERDHWGEPDEDENYDDDDEEDDEDDCDDEDWEDEE